MQLPPLPPIALENPSGAAPLMAYVRACNMQCRWAYFANLSWITTLTVPRGRLDSRIPRCAYRPCKSSASGINHP